MLYVVLAAIALAVAIVGPRFVPATAPPIARPLIRVLALAWVAVAVLSTSIVRVPADEVGVVRKIYGAHSLPAGHIIATNGETGYQAEIIAPGSFKVWPFFNVLNSVTDMPVVTIPQGFYGRVVARDGENLRAGQIMADAWKDDEYASMLSAQYFMTHHGQRGLQLSVLKPGTYPINLALYQVKIGFTPKCRSMSAISRMFSLKICASRGSASPDI